MNDNELLDLIYEDTASGVSKLIDTYADLVDKLVCDVLYDVAPDKYIDECVADSFVAFYDNADDVDLSRGSIRAYLGVIALRRAVNLYYTLLPDDERSFPEYTVEEMTEVLENETSKENPELSRRIKLLCFKEIAPDTVIEELEDEPPVCDETYEYEEEYTAEEDDTDTDTYEPEVIIKKQASRFGRVLKTLISMVTLVAVITVGVIAFDRISSAQKETTTTTTTQPTTQTGPYNPLLSAIIEGNEKLIESLVGNSLLLTQDILKYAIESADKISYDNIRRIAEEVKNKYGSTGLEPILEGAIFGDFQYVLDKLKEKDESEMTPAEKLAYFFATTIGSETN